VYTKRETNFEIAGTARSTAALASAAPSRAACIAVSIAFETDLTGSLSDAPTALFSTIAITSQTGRLLRYRGQSLQVI
jgi:hypothetical protein